MLMSEVASAEDTLELWKMINDGVWASLQQLRKQELEQQSAQRRAAAAKASARKPRKVDNGRQMPEFKPVPVAAPRSVTTAPKAVVQPQASATKTSVSALRPAQLGNQQRTKLPEKPPTAA